MVRNSKHWEWWLAIGLLCSAAALAAKPPGGQDPPGSNGGEVIYFSWNGNLYTMNDNGSGVAPVAGFPYGYGPWGDPSRQLHAGERWFVQTKEVPGEFYPDFHPNGVRKDFANRRVLVALSDGADGESDVVELTIAADLEPLEAPKWTVGDKFLSWAGRRWGIVEGNSDYGHVLEGGLYVTPLEFDAAGNVSGMAQPSSLLVPFVPLVPSNAYRQYSDFTDGPDMYNHDWAPDGTHFVFDAVSAQELRICDAETVEFDVLFSDLGADNIGAARWSPAGDKIMFNYDPDLGHHRAMTINADGTRLKMLARGTPEWSVSMGVWSPAGSHLLYQHWDHWEADSYIIRATASGTSATRITDESMGAGMQSPQAIGWR